MAKKTTELKLVKWVENGCPPIDLNKEGNHVLQLVRELQDIRKIKLPAEIIQLYQVNFDDLENHGAISTQLIGTFIGDGKLSAHGICNNWIRENKNSTEMYLSYNSQIYPQFYIEKINPINDI